MQMTLLKNSLIHFIQNIVQDGLETSMKGSVFIFDSVQLMYYKCHKVDFECGGSYIVSPDWIKKKKAAIHPKNEDDKCFQYAATVALNYEKIKWNPERFSNIKPFINKYNWKKINYPSKIDDWKRFEKIQQLLLIFCMLKNKKYFQFVFKTITQPVKKQ